MKPKTLHPSTLITDHLDTWTSAMKAKSSAGRGSGKKQEFYGTKKLRELILKLAVQGFLVPQNPTDEPASVLIERVSNSLPEKKSENPFLYEIEASITDESEFKLPGNWAWIPLGHIGIWATGCGFPTKYQGEVDREFLFCKVSDMNLPGNEVEIHTTAHTIDSEVLNEIRARSNPSGTVIFPKIGGAIATHKRRVVIKPTIIDNNCSGIQPIGLTDNQWMLLLMRSVDLTKYQSGTSVPAVSQSSLDPIRIGLPPLAEQHRIVAKVDELMALCDQLERQQEDSAGTHAALVQTLLGALTAASERGAFAEAWQRIASHFDTLFTTESSIDQLKQTILQLAVMGKLVEQDPEGGAATTVSMEKLVGRKNLKNGLSLSPVSGPSDFVCLPLSAMKGATIDCSFGKPIAIEPDRAAPYLIKEGDVFIIRGNGSKERVGVAGMARSCPPNVLFPDLFIRVPLPPAMIDGNYFLIAWNSATNREKLEILATTTSGIWKVNQGHISECEIPLPPLAEQHGIVAKVDELMALCDRLKARLQSAQTTQLHLADTLVEAATH